MYCISTTLYLDTSDYSTNSRGVYKNIVTISPEPPNSHPLHQYSRQLHTTKLSDFKDDQHQIRCFIALNSFINPNKLMTEDEIPELMIEITNKGLTISPNLSQIVAQNLSRTNIYNRKVLFFIN